MFSGPMTNAWEVATVVAVVAGVVGFFTVLRGSAFAAHALPAGAFSGAAGASLIGVNPIVGLAVFSIGGAFAIGGLGRRARQDVAVALAIVAMFALGALFLSMTTEYAPEIFALLFGEVLGVASNEVLATAVIGSVAIAAIVVLYRPLMLSSVVPEVAASRGVSEGRMEICFLLVIALTTTAAVPVVGSLLVFTLLISPAAAARCFTHDPAAGIGLSVAIACLTVWTAIWVSYLSGLPIGFFVGVLGASWYLVGRVWGAWRRRRSGAGLQGLSAGDVGVPVGRDPTTA